MDTCCGAASSTTTRPKSWHGTCSASSCSPAGAFEPWPSAKGATTPLATTWEPSGPLITRSLLGASAATDSKMKPRWSRLGSWRLLLLRTMLGLHPVSGNLVVDAALPSSIGRLELLDIPGRWGKVDAFGRGRIEPRGL